MDFQFPNWCFNYTKMFQYSRSINQNSNSFLEEVCKPSHINKVKANGKNYYWTTPLVHGDSRKLQLQFCNAYPYRQVRSANGEIDRLKGTGMSRFQETTLKCAYSQLERTLVASVSSVQLSAHLLVFVNMSVSFQFGVPQGCKTALIILLFSDPLKHLKPHESLKVNKGAN